MSIRKFKYVINIRVHCVRALFKFVDVSAVIISNFYIYVALFLHVPITLVLVLNALYAFEQGILINIVKVVIVYVCLIWFMNVKR